MKREIKVFLITTLLLSLIINVFPPRAIAEIVTQQGEQYEKGNYNHLADSPYGTNWNRNSPFNSSNINKVKWTYELQENTITQFAGDPAIGEDGTIYIGNQTKTLYAFNRDGSIKWKLQDMIYFTSPIIGKDNTIYTAYGQLNAINPDGTIKWKTNVTNANFSTPVIGDDGTIYATSQGSNTRFLYVFNSDGSLKWKGNTDLGYNNQNVDLLISNMGTIFSLSRTNSTHTINAHSKNGELIWSRTYAVTAGAFSLDNNGDLLMLASEGTYKQKIMRINSGNGEIVAESVLKNSGVNKLYAPIIDKTKNTIFVNTSDGVKALNTDFSVKWSYASSGAPSPMIIDSDGNIIFSRTNKGVISLYPTGELRWIVDGSYNSDLPAFYSMRGISIDKHGIIYIPHSTQKTVNNKNEVIYNFTAIGKDQPQYCTRYNDESLKNKINSKSLSLEEANKAKEDLSALLEELDQYISTK
ncbi:PQQ-binding-like beta-propeller repeat protein [Rossellomorea marisflavi]|uniref:PQQ-binding-like beta-propeller repeat protein n=1 Tax=Rossellomorea marisflavi TaxID=189381 RepID=UPI00345DF1C9